MTSRITILLAATCGAVIGAGSAYFLLAKRSSEVGEKYQVHHIVGFRQYKGNGKAILQAYINGNHGHVKDISCLFPPEVPITGALRARAPRKVDEKDKSLSFVDKYGYELGFDQDGVADDPDWQWQGVTRFKIVGIAASSNASLYYCERLE